MSAGRLAELVEGKVVFGSPEAVFSGLVIDSRLVVAGCAFFAFPGENVDGATFVPAAVAAGAHVALVTRWDDQLAAAMGDSGAAIVLAGDAGDALRAVASHHRSRLRCPVVGITGSTGKTTTKDFLAAALSTSMRVVATSANHNNELGVPLTLLEASGDTDVLVVEMGMRGPGQIEGLCAVARPTLGLVTNIGQTHIELLGSQDAIVRAKGELVACIPAAGAVFLNGDDEMSRSLASQSRAPVTWYGLGAGVDVGADEIEVDELGRPSVTLRAGGDSVRVDLPVPGRHNAYTAAAAAAVALHLGVTLERVAEGLAGARVSDMRMQVFTAANGVTVVNDAYNASPTSMRAAVTALADMRTTGLRVAVLGDMAELGSLTDLAHFRLGEQVATAGIDVLVTVGERARRIGEGARASGMSASSIRTCLTPDEASEVLDDVLAPDDVVLVKASRVMNLERIVEGILHPHA
jgi:UDP-N-acetylmuramoyl-tripeptide--D-alanyl-D-alanine ligase